MSVASVAALRTAGSGRCRGAGSPQLSLNGGRPSSLRAKSLPLDSLTLTIPRLVLRWCRRQVLDDAEEGAGDQRRDRARRLLLDGHRPGRRQWLCPRRLLSDSVRFSASPETDSVSLAVRVQGWRYCRSNLTGTTSGRGVAAGYTMSSKAPGSPSCSSTASALPPSIGGLLLRGTQIPECSYNIPELAKKYKVYAIDLLGFGWSEKALVDYEATIWMEQVADFLREIVKEPAVVVGNSLGGFTTLFTATEVPELVRGVVLLNSAGQFADPSKPAAAPAEEEEGSPLSRFIVKPLKEAFQRVVLGFLFWQSKQPARVEKVLKSVYIDSSNVDEYLIGSITAPTADPNAGEVYYRLMSRFMSNQSRYTLDRLLGKMSCPLLLLWGDLDPWVGPAKAARIQEFYADTTVVHLQAGHCPHDEAPEQANRALLEWLAALDARAKPAEPTLQTV
ncbi:hypothetical protein HU200_012439 [Digitaria exilis]|uniref:AB hydrolase-1 domain-containing protein n=1 Tax=Digitaria exilis TaxID=1010633 RepID=A0A835FEV5_9POAL|nr:hypothetical protein HU200_012439 [Digitaria exilis]